MSPLQKIATTLKKFWAGINKIINKNSNNDDIPVCIEIENNGNVNTITDPKDIADAFNSHYTSVAKTQAKVLAQISISKTYLS